MSHTGVPHPLPPGTIDLSGIEAALTFSLLSTFFGGILIPLIVLLFLFSNPGIRRHPVFILNLSVLLLGLTLSLITIVQIWKSLIYPTTPLPRSLTSAYIAFDVISPIITDTVLIFRLLALFPRMTTPRHIYVAILAFPVIIKCARFSCVAVFLHKMSQTDGNVSAAVLGEKAWFRNPYLVSEWSLQIADNLYCASFFFWKLREFYMGGNRSFLVRNESLLAKIRGIFAIALANFVFPLFMNVTQLILIIHDSSYTRGAATMMANVYISIIGVLFATVWASGNAWGRNDTRSDQSGFQTTFSENPGYVRSRRDPCLAGRGTRLSGSQGLPRHYSVSLRGQSHGMGGMRAGIHVEQVVLRKVDGDDYSA